MMTECERVRASLLEAFDEPHALGRAAGVERHLRSCESCQAFASRHQQLDAQLASALRPPSLGPAFRVNLRRRVGREITSDWYEKLPDIMHVGSCVVATGVYAVLMPADLWTTVMVGATGTLLTYPIMNMVRSWLEGLDCT
jgi:anti-sigma factor RsiW